MQVCRKRSTRLEQSRKFTGKGLHVLFLELFSNFWNFQLKISKTSLLPGRPRFDEESSTAETSWEAYFKSTRLGLWLYAKFDLIIDYLVERWGWTWLQQPEDAWRKKYPHVTKKIDELEARIKRLEK